MQINWYNLVYLGVTLPFMKVWNNHFSGALTKDRYTLEDKFITGTAGGIRR